MDIIKTRKDMAEFLARLSWADFPLAVERPATGGFIISGGGEGRVLGRYAYNEADIAEEAGRLGRIIARLNGFHAAAGNRLLRPTAGEAAQFQLAMRRAWRPKLKERDKIGATGGIYAAAKLPRWSIAIDGPKIRPASVLDRAARLGLSNELAQALFGRMLRAGIMALGVVTYGAKDYDLRYHANFGRLEDFLRLSGAKLAAALAPPAGAALAGAAEPAGAVFPADLPIVWNAPAAEDEADEE